MSHTAKIPSTMTNKSAMAMACAAMGIAPPTEEKAFEFYDGRTAAGTGIRLPNWRFPVIVGADGSLTYDDYRGAWGKTEHLNRFRQEYSLAVMRQTMGSTHRITTQVQEDGRLRVFLEQ